MSRLTCRCEAERHGEHDTTAGGDGNVRGQLGVRYSVAVAKTRLHLTTGGQHIFNAVAIDGSVVATIMNSSGPTSGGKKPVGKLRGALAELYMLSLVDAPTRTVITTNPSFRDLLERETSGALASGLSLKHVGLPFDLAEAVTAVHSERRDE